MCAKKVRCGLPRQSSRLCRACVDLFLTQILLWFGLELLRKGSAKGGGSLRQALKRTAAVQYSNSILRTQACPAACAIMDLLSSISGIFVDRRHQLVQFLPSFFVIVLISASYRWALKPPPSAFAIKDSPTKHDEIWMKPHNKTEGRYAHKKI
jgi:hypothetical protein